MNMQTRTHKQIQVIELHGRFDAHVVPEVKAWQDAAADISKIVVNLSGVHFVDSAALATLVRGMKRCRQQGGDLRICGLQQPVRIIFELTKLDKAFDIRASEAEAIQAFGA